jgi:hypothetical protein
MHTVSISKVDLRKCAVNGFIVYRHCYLLLPIHIRGLLLFAYCTGLYVVVTYILGCSSSYPRTFHSYLIAVQELSIQ